MLSDTMFSLSHASPSQIIAFVGFALFTIGFFIWVAWLAKK